MSYLTLPGTSGNYVSVPDTNLLDADMAHIYQSIGSWREGSNCTIASTPQVPPVAIPSGLHAYALKCTATANGSLSASQCGVGGASSPVAASAATEYTIGVQIYTDVADRMARVFVYEYDSGGSGTQSGGGSFTSLAVGGWTYVERTWTTHASTAKLIFQIIFDEDPSGTVTAGDVWYQADHFMSAGDVDTFVPSLRIVGDLDIEAKVAATDWTSVQTIFDGDVDNAGNKGYMLYVTSDLIAVHFPVDGSGNRTESSNLGGLTDGEPITVRWQADVSAGTGVWLLDGAQVDTDTFTTGAIGVQTAGNPATVGATSPGTSGNFAGDIYYVIVRDGIDGPIVSSTNFTDLTDAELDAASFTAADTYHTATLNGDEWAYPRLKTTISGKTPELYLDARAHTDGIPMWSDRTGNGHNATFGSAAGSDTNDPVFKKWDGTNYTYLPGTTGNYVSTADVNLLDADTAHLQQSVGAWNAWLVATGVGQSQALTPLIGDYHGVATISGAGADRGVLMSGTGTGAIPVSAATQYTVSAGVACTASLSWYITALFYDAGGNFLSSSPTAGTALNPSSFTRISNTFTTPASTAFVAPILYNGDNGSDTTVYWDAACLNAGTSSTFVPSLRIVGDLDIEAKAACTDDTVTNGATLISRYNTVGTSRSYRMHLDTGTIAFWYGDAAASFVGNDYTHGLDVSDVITWRVTRAAASGAITYYADGAQIGTDSSAAGAVNAGDLPLNVGAAYAGTSGFFPGDIYYTIVRDGIDGPVVARYDAADAVEPFATQTGTVDDRTYTYNRSASGYVSTVVDRDMFLLSTDDYFTVPDADALDRGSGQGFTVLAAFRGIYGSNDMVISKGGAGAVGGYSLSVQGNRAYWYSSNPVGGNSTSVLTAANSLPTDYVLHVAGGILPDGRDDTHWVVLDGSVNEDSSDTVGSLSNPLPLNIGRYSGGSLYWEGQIIAVALFREALTEAEIRRVGYELSTGINPLNLHGDALFTWLRNNETFTSRELVGALNELNGTSGVEYRKARRDYLGL